MAVIQAYPKASLPEAPQSTQDGVGKAAS